MGLVYIEGPPSILGARIGTSSGAQGPAGPAGPTLTFASESARDTHFTFSQANRDVLVTNFPIVVASAESVSIQVWRGSAAPDQATYTSEAASSWDISPIQTSSASLRFQDELVLYDLGERLAFDDEVSGDRFLLIGQRFDYASGGTQDAVVQNFNAVSDIVDTLSGAGISETGPLAAVQSSTFDTTGLIPSGSEGILVSTTLNFAVAPNTYRTEIFEGTDATGTLIFSARFNIAGTGEQTLTNRSSQRFKPNTTYFTRRTADIPFQLRGQTVSGSFVPGQRLSGTFVTESSLALDSDKEDSLGNPSTDGHVLSSTAAGVRSWVAPGAGGTTITVQDEGTALTAGASTLDFRGSGVTATGSGATKTITIPGPSAGANPFIDSTRVPTGVVSGTWTQTDFDGVYFEGDNTVTTLAAGASTTFGIDTFFVISNGNTVDLTFDVSAATSASFSGLGSGQTHTISAGTATLFFHDNGGLAPIANYNTAAGGASGDHPVVLTRATPSLADLNTIAQESLNDNSGLWVVANNQISSEESTVDSSIMVRALQSGLMDASGGVIPTSATAKSGVLLAGGSIVRVFSSTDLRVVSTPNLSATARYPDIPTTLIAGQTLNLVGNQVLYNTYRNRTAIFDINTTGFIEVRLPSLQNAIDLAYLNRNDVFCFRHDGTNGEVRVRTFQVGTVFSDTTQTITLTPGQVVCVSPAPSGAVWQILAIGQSSDISTETISINTDWYRDESDATAADNAVRLHHRQEITDGLVRDHIVSSSAGNNPISLSFQHRNLQDDRAWVAWWATWDSSVPAVGINSIEEIEANIEAALTYISSNIAAGFDFEFEAPDSVSTIQSIGFVSGNTVRYTLHTNFISTSFAVNHPVRIQGATNSVHNGVFLVDSIGNSGSNVTIHVTNIGVSDGTQDESSTSAFMGVPVYADVAFISNDRRTVNFNLYNDSARTSPRTSFNEDWFNHTNENAASVLSIGYNNDVVRYPSQVALQDDAGDWFVAKGGPRGSVTLFDNRTSYSSSANPLPVSYENIIIDTLGVSSFYIPEYPDHLEPGETRRYTVESLPTNGGNDTVLFVGAPDGQHVVFDEGFNGVDILPGTRHTIELYNDGSGNSGVKLVTPLSKTVPAFPNFSTPQAANTAQVSPLPITIALVIAAQNEDINSRFFNVGSTNANKLTLQADADYIFDASVEVLFNGSEGTGVLFVPATLIPVITRGTADDKEEFAHTVSLIFSRNGQSGSSAPKFSHTLRSRFEWQGRVGDIVEFQLRFGTFPAGYSSADIQVKDWRWTATAQLNLD